MTDREPVWQWADNLVMTITGTVHRAGCTVLQPGVKTWPQRFEDKPFGQSAYEMWVGGVRLCSVCHPTERIDRTAA